MSVQTFLRSWYPRQMPWTQHTPRRSRHALSLERLDERAMLAVDAVFQPITGTLTVLGDATDNTIVVSRNAAGELLVNHGSVTIVNGTPTVGNTALIEILGFGGDDDLSLDESLGALPAAKIHGGSGNDMIRGGSGSDLLVGDAGDDMIFGMGGNDQLFGGAHNDTLIGGPGDDQMYGEDGDDQMIWNPGDGTDLMEGGMGVDVVRVHGGDDGEFFTTTANGARVRFDRLDPEPFAIDIGTSEHLVLLANGGDDLFAATGNLAALIGITVDGGDGDDSLMGSNGQDVLIGGAGNDYLDGNQGNDTLFGGAGDDVVNWDPGDGNDTVEGEGGMDRLVFHGSAADELIELSPNGSRLRVARNIGTILLNVDGVETVQLLPRGGSDTVYVEDLSPTDVALVTVDLGIAPGNNTGDAQIDRVIVHGTSGDDVIEVTGTGSEYSVTGTAAHVSVVNSEGSFDILSINAGDGNDTIWAGSLPAEVTNVMMNGGNGHDELYGGHGEDWLMGGPGNDILVGGGGNDLFFGEDGDDRMIWNPGDGTDMMEGGNGMDQVEIHGGDGNEVFTTSANGTRVRFDRLSPAPFALDIGTSERLVLNAHGGDDQFSAVGNLAALISITVDGGDGNDTLMGGNGADTLIGGAGNDLLDGNQGNDLLLLGDGDDRVLWDPGDGNDTVEGASGMDRIVFSGSATNETFDLSANNDRLRLTRNVGNIVLDIDGVEAVEIQARGGADIVHVNDLSATDVTFVTVDLALTPGTQAGDSQADAIVVHGTDGTDCFEVLGSGMDYSVMSKSMMLSVLHSEGSQDALTINAHGGDDVMMATMLPAGITKLTMDGGAGRDQIFGSLGSDVLLGGVGNDLIDGHGGDDLISMGQGNDTFLWKPEDGNDIVEGDAGMDRMLIHGSDTDESYSLVPAGSRLMVVRNNMSLMDVESMENIEIIARGGADQITIDDLTGTGVQSVLVDLAGMPASQGGDGHADRVIVAGSAADDVMTLRGNRRAPVMPMDMRTGTPGDSRDTYRDEVSMARLPSPGVTVASGWGTVSMMGADGMTDRLIVNGMAGADVIDASMVPAGMVQLELRGGLHNDVLIGSHGDDLIDGDGGNDTVFMGGGNDTYFWDPGDGNDSVDGQGGMDRIVMNGSAANENYDLSVNGSQLRLTRDVGNVAMNLANMEIVDVRALGGSDHVKVNDMSGTGVMEVNVHLGAPGTPTGDNQSDQVSMYGTNDNDTIFVMSTSNGVVASSGWGFLHIFGGEAANDRLKIFGLAGDDTIDASGVTVGQIELTLSGDDGDDVLIGGDGDDILLGGEGDDFLMGGPGVDLLDGGPGDNVLIQ